MPIDVGIVNSQLIRCSECPELMNHEEDAIPGYHYGCKLLQDSAFNMISDEIIELRAIFPDCPKLEGTENEGTRYKVYDRKAELKVQQRRREKEYETVFHRSGNGNCEGL